MSVEIVKLSQKDARGFSIWIDGNEAFDDIEFLKLIAPLGIDKNERVFSSFGPAQLIDEIHTKNGTFRLSQEFDEYAGVAIYSDSNELMTKILNIMLNSERYHVRT